MPDERNDLERIVGDYEGLVRKAALRAYQTPLGRQIGTLEDAEQAGRLAMIVALQKGTWQSKEDPESYLASRIFHAVRKQAKEAQLYQGDEDVVLGIGLEGKERIPTQPMPMTRGLCEVLQDALESLVWRSRAILGHLYGLGGYSKLSREEAAVTLGMSVERLDKLASMARRQMKQALKKRGVTQWP